MNGQTTDDRDWMLGSFLHSRPHIIHYADRSVIYAGANDGMLYAFDDAPEKNSGPSSARPPEYAKYLHTETLHIRRMGRQVLCHLRRQWQRYKSVLISG